MDDLGQFQLASSTSQESCWTDPGRPGTLWLMNNGRLVLENTLEGTKVLLDTDQLWRMAEQKNREWAWL